MQFGRALWPARRSFVLIPVLDVFVAVPANDRKAEAGAADFDVGPSRGTLGIEKPGNPDALVHYAPASIPIARDECISITGHPEAICSAFGNNCIRLSVAVEVAAIRDTAGFIA